MQKRIRKDMLQAMKDNDVIKKETLRLILSEIKNEQIKQKKELKDEDITKIIKRGLKTRAEAMKLFQQGNRQDLVEKTKKEINTLEIYLPKQLSQEELKKIVLNTISELGASGPKDTGKVMKEIMSKYSSQTDGKTVQQIVSSKLSKEGGT